MHVLLTCFREIKFINRILIYFPYHIHVGDFDHYYMTTINGLVIIRIKLCIADLSKVPVDLCSWNIREIVRAEIVNVKHDLPKCIAAP